MGLDMFLYKVKKVGNYGLEEIYAAERCIKSNLNVETVTLMDPPYTYNYSKFMDFTEEQSRSIFEDFHHAGAIRIGTYGPNWSGIPEDAPICNILYRIMYWRKAYSIDNWIFDHMREDGEEYSGKPNFLPKEIFSQLCSELSQTCELIAAAQQKIFAEFKELYPAETRLLEDYAESYNRGENPQPTEELSAINQKYYEFYSEKFIPVAKEFPYFAFDEEYESLGADFYADTLLYSNYELGRISEDFDFDTDHMLYRRDF